MLTGDNVSPATRLASILQAMYPDPQAEQVDAHRTKLGATSVTAIDPILNGECKSQQK